MTTSGLPFDDIRDLAGRLPAPDETAAARIRTDLAGSGLGRVAELAAWYAASTGRVPARVTKPLVALFAATHAVSHRLGVADPAGEGRRQVEAIAAGAVPISHLCAANDLGLNVFDLALDLPVGDITREAALDERACAATMAFGMEAVATEADLLCLGTVGEASIFSAMAILSALGGNIGEWARAAPQVAGLLGEALNAHAGHLDDPLEVLRRLGGREIAALSGTILAARTQKVAVLLDGLPATAAAAVLHALHPSALQHCRLADARDRVHRKAAEQLGLKPLFDLGMEGGDGAAVALAAGLVRSAGEISAGMAEVRSRGQAG